MGCLSDLFGFSEPRARAAERCGFGLHRLGRMGSLRRFLFSLIPEFQILATAFFWGSLQVPDWHGPAIAPIGIARPMMR